MPAAPFNSLQFCCSPSLSRGAGLPICSSASKFTFTIDAGEVIKGWDQGVKGMRVGGKRTLVCPPTLGYGKRGSPPEIPGDATLHFTVTLIAVQ